MPTIDVLVSTTVPKSSRVQQLSAMFDAPIGRKLEHRWQADFPIDERDWKIGLIVGPSGSGKTQIAKYLWPEQMDRQPTWGERPVIDEFPKSLGIEEITNACSAVGFNTIPSWAKPYGVLSTGEQFRVNLARLLVESSDLCVMDEFTSVVDRQVAKTGSHAVQKHIRREGSKRFVGVTCHYDVIDWLRPDWTFDPSTRTFAWRSLQPRPDIDIIVSPVPYAAWAMFAPFHYLTASLHKAARCFGLFADGRLVSFLAMLHRTGRGKARSFMGGSRIVTLPDFQGMGFGPCLMDTVASIYAAVGIQVHVYPAHPSFVRLFDRNPRWVLRKRPGLYSSRWGGTAHPHQGGRPCAVFRYVGESCGVEDAERVLSYWSRK